MWYAILGLLDIWVDLIIQPQDALAHVRKKHLPSIWDKLWNLNTNQVCIYFTVLKGFKNNLESSYTNEPCWTQSVFWCFWNRKDHTSIVTENRTTLSNKSSSFPRYTLCLTTYYAKKLTAYLNNRWCGFDSIRAIDFLKLIDAFQMTIPHRDEIYSLTYHGYSFFCDWISW